MVGVDAYVAQSYGDAVAVQCTAFVGGCAGVYGRYVGPSARAVGGQREACADGGRGDVRDVLELRDVLSGYAAEEHIVAAAPYHCPEGINVIEGAVIVYFDDDRVVQRGRIGTRLGLDKSGFGGIGGQYGGGTCIEYGGDGCDLGYGEECYGDGSQRLGRE